MQQSGGGLLLTPVQKLVSTIIFFRERKKMHIESYIRSIDAEPPEWVVFLFGFGR